MWRLALIALAACAAMPAHAGYIYELSGVVTGISDGEGVPDVVHVGETFHVTIEYYATGLPSSNLGCSSFGSISTLFTFEHTTVSGHMEGCAPRSGLSAFFTGEARGSGELDGYYSHDASIGMPGLTSFPVDISDEAWLQAGIGLLMFSPDRDYAVVYEGKFTEVISRRVPEPSTIALFGMGLLGIAFGRRAVRTS